MHKLPNVCGNTPMNPKPYHCIQIQTISNPYKHIFPRQMPSKRQKQTNKIRFVSLHCRPRHPLETGLCLPGAPLKCGLCTRLPPEIWAHNPGAPLETGLCRPGAPLKSGHIPQAPPWKLGYVAQAPPLKCGLCTRLPPLKFVLCSPNFRVKFGSINRF